MYTVSSQLTLKEYVLSEEMTFTSDDIAIASHLTYTQGMLANAYFFGHPVWAKNGFDHEIHDQFWKSRWQAVIPSWDNKIVVDIGCGFGHVLAKMGGKPTFIVGVDISFEALKHAQQLGYVPLLADAQNLPLKSHFADIVTLNATLHHCDDMVTVLSEAARLVKPNGLLVTDLDPQKTAWDFKGLGVLVNKTRRRFPSHWPPKFSNYRSLTEINMRLATELHNTEPGDGVTPELYSQALKPLGFKFRLYPHNHNVGNEVFNGELGQLPRPHKLAQQLSGIQPNQPASAQSVMCVAHAPD